MDALAEITRYQIRKCTRTGCGLRFPQANGATHSERCPRCGASTRLILERPLEREALAGNKPTNGGKRVHLEVLLDNVRSAWNVGSIFRTADGLGIQHLHLCGVTPTPDNPKVAKTSLGAEFNLPWHSYPDGLALAHTLIEQGYTLWALEQDARAISLLDGTLRLPNGKLLLVVGNELAGVDPEILGLCEQVVNIPMHGTKRSFNVAVAFGIAAYLLAHPK